MTRAVFLAATLLAITVYAQTRNVAVAMGNLGVHYNIDTPISTDAHPLTATASGPIWCQATVNEVPLPILRSSFVRYVDPQRRRFQPNINHTTNRASLQVEETVIHNMGKYRCEIQINDNDEERTVFGNLMVYSSPFFHTNGYMNMVADEHDKNEINADKVHATEGAPIVIACPAVGYPKPTIQWYKNVEPLVHSAHFSMSNNNTLLTIDKFTAKDEGEYRCLATNEYPTRLDQNPEQHEASLTQEVRIGENFFAKLRNKLNL